MRTKLIGIFLLIGAQAVATTELNLDEQASSLVEDKSIFSFGTLNDVYAPGTKRHTPNGYGTGFYGDPLRANFSTRRCSVTSVDREGCTANMPDSGQEQWRFIENLGWYKFTPYGAARKDWWEYKQTLRYPFSRWQTYGYRRDYWDWFYNYRDDLRFYEER